MVRRAVTAALLLVLVGTPASALELPKWYSNDPFSFKMQHEKSPTWTWRWWLDVLTGVELNLTFGHATITHKVRDQFGSKIPVAHGREQLSGFGVGLLDAPRRTTIGVRPDFGFFSNHILVRGFEQSIPWEENTFDLPGTCTDVETGEPVNCRKAFDYDLRLRSLYLGPQLYGAVVVHNSWFEVFLLGTGAISLAELRWLRVEAADETRRQTRFAFLRNVSTGLALGATFPRQHMSFRIGIDYSYYLRFRYPEPLEFEGPITYDEDRESYNRPRVAMDGASMSTFATTLAAGYLF